MQKTTTATTAGNTRIVLVRPMHEINIGSVARAMKNFGYTDLVLVSPRTKIGFQTRLYAKHSEDVLEKMRVVKTIREATRGCTLVVATTGAPRRFQKKNLKNCLNIREAAIQMRAEKTAVLFGPEDTGLSEEELETADLTITIPTHHLHPVLNLSHAVAVVCHELHSLAAQDKQLFTPAQKKNIESLEKLFARLVSRMQTVRDKKKVSNAFKRVLRRARPSEQEVQALFAAVGELSKMLRRIK